MVDFLLSDDPFNYELVLLSYAEDGTSYEGGAFCKFYERTQRLLSILGTARDIVMKRVSHRQCQCADLPIQPFHTDLLSAFSNETLYTFLFSTDELHLDLLKIDLHHHAMSFPVKPVLIAYHNVRTLRVQLSKVVSKLNINIYAWM